MFGFIGATAGSYAGWALGIRYGMMTAFAASMVGTGAGLYYGRRLGEHLLG